MNFFLQTIIDDLYYVSLNCNFHLYHFNNLCQCFERTGFFLSS